jgi:hypothetical protein
MEAGPVGDNDMEAGSVGDNDMEAGSVGMRDDWVHESFGHLAKAQ